MKISELNNKSFLSAPGAVANSYVLVNYADTANSTPVTYKATVQELGKAIASNLNLLKDTVAVGGMHTAKTMSPSANSTVYDDTATEILYKDAPYNVQYNPTSGSIGYMGADGSTFNTINIGGDDILEDGTYKYLLSKESNGFYYLKTKDSTGFVTNVGVPVLASEDNGEYTLQTMGGSSITLPASTPYEATVSGTNTPYVFYNASAGLCINARDSYEALGHPVFMKESNGTIVLKDASGSDISLNGAEIYTTANGSMFTYYMADSQGDTYVYDPHTGEFNPVNIALVGTDEYGNNPYIYYSDNDNLYFTLTDSSLRQYLPIYYNASTGMIAQNNNGVDKLGHIVYYSDNSNCFGYKDSNGDFTSLNITPTNA